MGVVGKTKDTVESREDLKIMGVRRDLHLIPNPNGGSSMPTACFTFSKTKNKVFCNWLNSVKFPDGFASNISSCVDVTDCKLSGLKSHDCHILIQRLLLVAVRGLLTKKVSTCIIELCTFFKALCARTVSVKVVEQLQKDIFKILCKMETIFRPSFFTVMVHLAIHLPREVLLGGPVHGRWMYFGERYLGLLKRCVKNLARPDGSIAGAYINMECLSYCCQYLDELEREDEYHNRNNVTSTNIDSNLISVFSNIVRPLGKAITKRLDDLLFTKAQLYILNNCDEVAPYMNCGTFEYHQERIPAQS